MEVQRLKKLAKASSVGVISLETVSGFTSHAEFPAFSELQEWGKSIISFTFPYRAEGKGNLASFARGKDYHVLIRERLEPVVEEIEREFPGSCNRIYVDNAPYPEVLVAHYSGAAVMKKNGMVSCVDHDDTVLLGEVVTDLDLTATGASKDALMCADCDLCIRACPTHAIVLDPSGHRILLRDRCLSALTQQKAIDEDQESLLKKAQYIWGCDTCIKACEHRKAADDFLFDRAEILSLSLEDVENESNASFKKKFADYPFTWKGVQVLKRNLGLHKEE